MQIWGMKAYNTSLLTFCIASYMSCTFQDGKLICINTVLHNVRLTFINDLLTSDNGLCPPIMLLCFYHLVCVDCEIYLATSDRSFMAKALFLMTHSLCQLTGCLTHRVRTCVWPTEYGVLPDLSCNEMVSRHADLGAWENLQDYVAIFSVVALSIKDILQLEPKLIFNVFNIYEVSQNLLDTLVTSLRLKGESRITDLAEHLPETSGIGMPWMKTFNFLEQVCPLQSPARFVM